MTNTENRENLELAAKAAGIVVLGYVENYDDFYWHGPSWGLIIEGANGVWNPLEDDGDALRLAVKLGLVIDTDYNNGAAAGSAYLSMDDFHEYDHPLRFGADRAAATRRAIVRAAAEIALAKAAGNV